ncbi:MAG: hypothetical protein ACFCVC_20555 [Acidimicrobiia bacterium]
MRGTSIAPAGTHRSHQSPQLRASLLALAAAGLVTGIWAGLTRAGALPAGGPIDPSAHGVVMVSGFFGALISLERAVALDRTWAFLAPPAATIGALGWGVGLPGAAWWSLGAAGTMTVASVLVWTRQRTLFVAVMAGGAASWAVAVGVALIGGSIIAQIPWLAAFLVVTIVGERLELSRLTPPSRWKTPTFVLTLALFLSGVAAASAGLAGGWRILGAGLVGLAGWLAVFDVARRTIRFGGVTRFIAFCLVSGYLWLGIAGVWWLSAGDLIGTLQWDGVLHAVFVGFVMSMVFGHVHMVAPAVLGVEVPYRRWFAAHLILLHVSLAARVVGDVVVSVPLRRWGAIGNAAAIGVFLVATLASVILARRRPVAGTDSRRGDREGSHDLHIDR